VERIKEASPSSNSISPDRPKLSQVDQIFALLLALRPRQWTKNLVIFVGILFAQRLLFPLSFGRAVIAFVVFCLASSSIYLFNDLQDLENDRQHPTKKRRPLASGALPVSWAIATIGLLWLCCIGLTTWLYFIPFGTPDIFAFLGGANILFSGTLVAYICIMILYSLRFKNVVILDVFIIASGFVLRILAGTVVAPVSISPWLYIVTVMLSLLLALGKRRAEIVLMEEQASNHRQILKEYSLPLLDQFITIVTANTVIAYSLYTFQATTGDHRLMVTIPLVLYGMFRYLYLLYIRKEGGNPEEVLLRDRHMLGTVVLCIAAVIIALYVL
jgi:4-hydroxybenzoate polyprenyltransferase